MYIHLHLLLAHAQLRDYDIPACSSNIHTCPVEETDRCDRLPDSMQAVIALIAFGIAGNKKLPCCILSL